MHFSCLSGPHGKKDKGTSMSLVQTVFNERLKATGLSSYNSQTSLCCLRIQKQLLSTQGQHHKFLRMSLNTFNVGTLGKPGS